MNGSSRIKLPRAWLNDVFVNADCKELATPSFLSLLADPTHEYVYVCIDSRHIQKDDVFWALPGARVNGYNFIDDAIKKGAAAVVCGLQGKHSKVHYNDTLTKDWPFSLQGGDTTGKTISKQILKDDWEACRGKIQELSSAHKTGKEIGFFGPVHALVSYQALAALFMKRWRGLREGNVVVAISGSAGKTTVTHFLSTICKAVPERPVHVTHGNENNAFGVPKTIFSMPDDTQIAIIEVGIGRPGDMARAMDMVKADHAILTTISYAHMKYFKDLRQLADEKWLLFRDIPEDGTAIFGGSPESDYLKDYDGKTKCTPFKVYCIGDNGDDRQKYLPGLADSTKETLEKFKTLVRASFPLSNIDYKMIVDALNPTKRDVYYEEKHHYHVDSDLELIWEWDFSWNLPSKHRGIRLLHREKRNIFSDLAFQLPYKFAIENLVNALRMAVSLKIDIMDGDIHDAIDEIEPLPLRFEKREKEIILILDCYNSNFASIHAGMDALHFIPPLPSDRGVDPIARKKWFVFGDIGECGDNEEARNLYRRCGASLRLRGDFSGGVAIGKYSSVVASSYQYAAAFASFCATASVCDAAAVKAFDSDRTEIARRVADSSFALANAGVLAERSAAARDAIRDAAHDVKNALGAEAEAEAKRREEDISAAMINAEDSSRAYSLALFPAFNNAIMDYLRSVQHVRKQDDITLKAIGDAAASSLKLAGSRASVYLKRLADEIGVLSARVIHLMSSCYRFTSPVAHGHEDKNKNKKTNALFLEHLGPSLLVSIPRAIDKAARGVKIGLQAEANLRDAVIVNVKGLRLYSNTSIEGEEYVALRGIDNISSAIEAASRLISLMSSLFKSIEKRVRYWIEEIDVEDLPNATMYKDLNETFHRVVDDYENRDKKAIKMESIFDESVKIRKHLAEAAKIENHLAKAIRAFSTVVTLSSDVGHAIAIDGPDNLREALDKLPIKKGDIVWVKGSRAMGLEEAVIPWFERNWSSEPKETPAS